MDNKLFVFICAMCVSVGCISEVGQEYPDCATLGNCLSADGSDVDIQRGEDGYYELDVLVDTNRPFADMVADARIDVVDPRIQPNDLRQCDNVVANLAIISIDTDVVLSDLVSQLTKTRYENYIAGLYSLLELLARLPDDAGVDSLLALDETKKELGADVIGIQFSNQGGIRTLEFVEVDKDYVCKSGLNFLVDIDTSE
ncbi:MAG: hypothetical protein ABH881_03475 [bacterium]